MRKAIGIVLMVSLFLMLVACGDVTVVTDNTQTQTLSPEIAESEPSTFPEVETVETEPTASLEEEPEETVEWRQFLQEYEAWVDDYISIVKKYKENPTDMTILTDYMEMLSDLTQWSQKADKIQGSILDTSEALEYSKEMLRIAGKLAEVGQ